MIKTNQAPFKADHVGSLLRPQRIKEARLQKEKGKISAIELRNIEDEEITKLVEKQKKAGLRSITDGDLRRSWWHFDFLEGLKGVEGFKPEEGIQFKGVQTKAHSVRVLDKVDFDQHPMLDDYKFLHSIVGPDHVAKFTIPSPNMLFFRGDINPEIYPDEASLLKDLTQAYQKAIQAFYDEGCRYLQLDDTSWAVFFSEEGRQKIKERGHEPEQLRRLFIQAINHSIAGRPDDMVITMHICRGNFRSTYTASGGYDTIAETLFNELNVDGLFLEYDTERSGGLQPLRQLKRKDLKIVLGFITSKFPELEDKEKIKASLEEAAKLVPKEQLCLSPQCGFASTEEGNIITEEEQWAKLRHVVEIAEEVWN